MVDREEEIVWTEEALRRVERAPAFVRPGIYKLMVKRAKERDQKIITPEFLTEIRNESMLRAAKCIRGFGFEELSMDAFEVAKEKMRKLPRKVEVIEEIKAFLEKRTEKNEAIIAKFAHYLQTGMAMGEVDRAEGPLEWVTMPWTAEAEERLKRIPIPLVRRMIIQRVEAYAKDRKLKVVDLEVYESERGLPSLCQSRQ